MASVGLDGWAFLSSPVDPADRVVAEHLINRVWELRDTYAQQHAVHVINTLGKALK